MLTTVFIFPGYAYSEVTLRRIVWYLFTRHGGVVNVVVLIKLLVVFTLLFLKYDWIESTSKEFQLLICGVIWLNILSVSIICFYIYIKMISNFKFGLLFVQCQNWSALYIIHFIIACMGLVSTYSLYQLVEPVHERCNIGFPTLWRPVLFITFISMLLQRLLASELVNFIYVRFVVTNFEATQWNYLMFFIF